MFRNRFPTDAPPLEMRVMTAERRAGVVLADDLPNYHGHSGKFMLKLIGAWIAMGFRRPEISLGKDRPSRLIPHGEERASLRASRTIGPHHQPSRRRYTRLLSVAPYSTPRPNLFDFGKPFGGRRPASARLPRQSASSLIVSAEFAAGGILPGQALLGIEGRDVGQPAIWCISAGARRGRAPSPAPDRSGRSPSCGCRRSRRRCRR